ncbi:MAG: CheR family methyltransferase [Candidatus Sericytochromatia bacterium]
MSNTEPLLYLIGIGASAGGLEPMQTLLAQFGERLEYAAIIIAQHLGSQHKSSLLQLLSQHPSLRVINASHGQLLEPNTVYVTPQDREISVAYDRIRLKSAVSMPGPKPSIDGLFLSLAREKRGLAVAVVLSGSGSDGAAGIEAIHRSGGLTLVQQPDTAQFDGMPQAAIATGCVDRVLSPEQIGQEIWQLVKQPPARLSRNPALEEEEHKALKAVFQTLSQHSGTDFLNYKSSTLYRRLEKRLALLELESPDAYLTYLEAHPQELDNLFRTCIIGVTGFFRDPEAFKKLESSLEELLAEKGDEDPIRIWVPGCCTGEEAYTLAFILKRLLKERWQSCNLQVFASDLDQQAIDFARQGVYGASAVEGLPEDMLQLCFDSHGEKYEVKKEIRSQVLFTRHDLTSNPPFLKLDLISCRNLLIYFNPQLQKQLLPIFHYALNPNGILFLGKSESISEFSDLFETIDAESKIFRRKRGGHLRSMQFSAFRPQRQFPLELAQPRRKSESSIGDLVKETLFTSFEHPYVVINDSLDVQEISGDVRLYLGLGEGQINPNILRLVDEQLQLELMSVITRALREHCAIRGPICRFQFFGNPHYVRFSVKPMLGFDKGQDLFLVIFEAIDPTEPFSSISRSHPESGDVHKAELEHELATIKVQLQNYIEELETSNEDLQALNEELQSTNEELQSSNEELETSNEELQSTFEEVQMAYAELQSSNRLLEDSRRQLRETEAQIRALLDHSLQACLLLDRQGGIMIHNQEAERLLLRVSGQGLQLGQRFSECLRPDFREHFLAQLSRVLAGETVQGEFAVTSVAGAECWLAYHYTPIRESDIGLQGVSIALLDISERVQAQQRLRAQDSRFRALIENGYEGIALSDVHGLLSYVSPSVERMLGFPAAALIGHYLSEFVHADDLDAHRSLLAQLAAEQGQPLRCQWRQRHADGSWHWIEGVGINMSPVPAIGGVIFNFCDVSERRKQDEALRLSELRLRQIIDLIPAYVYARDREGRYLLANAMTARAFRRQVQEVEGRTLAELGAPLQFSPESLAADREVIDSSRIRILPAETLMLDQHRHQTLRTYKIPYITSDTGSQAALSVSLDIRELQSLEESQRLSDSHPERN